MWWMMRRRVYVNVKGTVRGGVHVHSIAVNVRVHEVTMELYGNANEHAHGEATGQPEA